MIEQYDWSDRPLSNALINAAKYQVGGVQAIVCSQGTYDAYSSTGYASRQYVGISETGQYASAEGATWYLALEFPPNIVMMANAKRIAIFIVGAVSTEKDNDTCTVAELVEEIHRERQVSK